jgi:DNA-binding transcriptional MocR family regulator
MTDYRALADELALDIKEGRLRPGQRLLPQREFADQRGIASSTASRVYAELVRRGLSTGEVGRGTYVRAGAVLSGSALAEPSVTPVDLELNFPVVPGQSALLAESLLPLFRRPEALAAALRPVRAAGTEAARLAAAGFLAQPGWSPDPAGVWFAGNGKQAIAASLAALVAPGERLGVEALTYPVMKGLASRLGIHLVPVSMDDEGLRPGPLAAAHRAAPLRGIYVQPTLHNPLGVTMSEGRRLEITAVLRRLDLFAIEDAVYAFLGSRLAPLAAHAPERCVLVDSLSKRLAPGLTVGLIVAPTALADRIASSLRSGAWTASGLALEAGSRWMTDGTAARISRAKRRDAAARQALVRAELSGLKVSGDPNAYHCWLELPDSWRAEPFVTAAARRGIAITPAAAFTVGSGHAPNAVRLALASPSTDALSIALETLAGLARARPEAWSTE